MRSDKLQNAIGMVDEDLVARTEKTTQKKKTRHVIKWTAPIAAMLAIALAFGIFFGQGSPFVPTAYALAEAEYPDIPKYPENYHDEEATWAWSKAQRERAAYFGKAEGLDSFIRATVPEFLMNAEDGNLVYSPLNVYLALSILAETTDGETREQILDLLGSKDIEALRENANALWNANYNDDGIVTSLLASSLWLRDGFTYDMDTLKTIAETYYASSFSGEMGSDLYNKQLQAWLDEQTGGLLSEHTKDVKMNIDTILAIATTIYFKASWEDKFDENRNTKDIFHAPSGDITTEFMNQSNAGATYYWGENFSAASLGLEESGAMWFILPDEDVSVDTLLQDEEVLSFLSTKNRYEWQNKKRALIHYSIPKFDVDSKLDLIKGMKNLGVTDCFDPFASDFTPLTTERDDLYVSKVEHAARVTIDEEGVVGAAYTLVIVTTESGTTAPPEEIDFIVDRPFMFAVTGEDGSILFVGVVNQVG